MLKATVLFIVPLLTQVIWLISENGPRLSVEMEQTKVISHRGGNATLPCKFHREFSSGTANSPKTRIKWTKLTTDYLKEIDVFVAMGNHKKSYGSYHGRVFLQEASDKDASLVITDVTLDDYGKYKCEIIEGLEDDTGVVTLDLQGNCYFAMTVLYLFNICAPPTPHLIYS